jgi:hypothetical protein
MTSSVEALTTSINPDPAEGTTAADIELVPLLHECCGDCYAPHA